MRAWDLFISHASEDKSEVVLPLAQALRSAGLRVWLDRQEIKIGDSLREKIDEGLANSHFGVVVLSPSFFGKGWPNRELSGLLAVEETAERTVLLPVWHNVDKRAVARHSPVLADRVAGDTTHGIDRLAAALLEVILEPGSGTPSELAPTPRRLLVDLLDRDPARGEIVQFIRAHPRTVSAAVGHSEPLAWSTAFGESVIDLVMAGKQYTTGEMVYHLVQFGPVMNGVVDTEGPTDAVREDIGRLESARRWIIGNLRRAREVAPGIGSGFTGIVVAGRRQALTAEHQETLRNYHDDVRGIRVRTYDWLVDGAGMAGGSG